MRRGFVVAAVLVTALFAATAQPVGASRYLQVGIFDEAQLLYGNVVPTIATFKQLHVQVIRVNLYWGGPNGVANAKPLHPTNPADPAYDWSIYDSIAEKAAADGMHLVFSIYGTPAWANHDMGQNVAPVNPLDLRKFAYAAALRYSGKFVSNGVKLPAVRDWLAWNEPNNPVFLTPQYRRVGTHWVMQSAISYAKICNAVYNGVHSTGYASEKVACGVTAPRGNNDPSSGRPSVSPLAFLRAVKRDGLRTFDAWAHNPYYAKPSEAPNAPDGAGGSVELGNIDTLIKLVTKLYGNKRIWITEYGYETNPPDPYFGVPWKTQAAYLTQAFAIARKNPRIDMMLWFLLVDDTNINGWQSGLITAAGKKKPSFAAFERMALDGSTYAGTPQGSGSPLLGEELAVETVDVVDEPLDAVARIGALAAGPGHRLAQLRVARQALESRGDALDVADAAQEAVGSVLDHVGDAADVGRDHRSARGQRLDRDHGCALVPRREQQRVEQAVVGGDILLVADREGVA